MFGLGRPDVLPTGDLGIRVAAQRVFALAEPPKPAELTERTEHWRPYRTVACWYLWRSLAGNAAV
jgi:DNA-3-methyladenine glycosylase II